MFDKLKSLLTDGNLLQELESKGIDTTKLKKAVENFPPVAQQIQQILASGDDKQTKIAKISTLIQKAARGESITGSSTTGSTT